MTRYLSIIAFFFIAISVKAQVGVNTDNPDPSAALDLVSTDKGLLIPRLDTSAVANPATGLMVFRPSDNGFYFYNGSKWQLLGSVVQSSLADADGDTKIQVEESPDEDVIRFDIEGEEKLTLHSDSTGRSRLEFPNNKNNIAIGLNTLQSNTSGYENIATGDNALQNNKTGFYNIATGTAALRENTTGIQNTATGSFALVNNTTGYHNTATGTLALGSNTTGNNNVATGHFSMNLNSTGSSNTAVGQAALEKNTSGNNNVATGSLALQNNTTGDRNVATGSSALLNNTTGDLNVATGSLALLANTTGYENVATGAYALQENTTGDRNVATGSFALLSNTTGNENVATGSSALLNNTTGFYNIATGYSALQSNTTGSRNTATGALALLNNTTGSKNVAIGYSAGRYELGSDKLYIENTGADSTGALIYGEFDKDSLRLNAAVNINGNYVLPTTSGGPGQTIMSNGSNELVWGNTSTLADTDNDTKIQVEESTDEDVIRIEIKGDEKFTLQSDSTGRSRLEFINNKNNTAIGLYTLQSNTTGSYNLATGAAALQNNTKGFHNTATGPFALQNNTKGYQNIATGSFALENNTTGINNVATGTAALRNNTTGNDNIATGTLALLNNTTGSKNVAIGYRAGKDELGSDKLYIENSDADSTGALIYGDFAADSLRLNAAVNINGNYVLPTTSGGPGQMIMSNGSNELVWGNTGALADADNDTKIQVEESPDEDIVRFDIQGVEKFRLQSDSTGRSRLEFLNNMQNTAIGLNTLQANTTGSTNVAIGFNSMILNSTGSSNAAVGLGALQLNTTGDDNVAIGTDALQYNTTGNDNVATGTAALQNNTTGNNNVAIGPYSMYLNSTGSNNAGLGESALQQNTSGDNNVATGAFALAQNTTGNSNVASGRNALRENTSGNNNVAIGPFTMKSNLVGISNSAIGQAALEENTSGDFNVASGTFSLRNNTTGNHNVAIGTDALSSNSTGSGNVAIGFNAGKNETGSSKLYIENTSANSSSALIYGDFAADKLRLNANVAIGNPVENTHPLTIRSSLGANSGIKIIGSGATGHWVINRETELGRLGFYYNGAIQGYLRPDENVAQIDFTAQHRNIPHTGVAEDYKDKIGMIVSSSGGIYNLDGSTQPTIMESLPHVELSTTAKDKRIYGVIAGVEDSSAEDEEASRAYSQGLFSTVISRIDENDYRLIVNSAGEGAVWVSNYNGNIENGDLIATAPIEGLGMKQDDDLIHNYTVAKVVMDCDFDLKSDKYECKEVEHEGKTYKVALLACVYKCN